MLAHTLKANQMVSESIVGQMVAITKVSFWTVWDKVKENGFIPTVLSMKANSKMISNKDMVNKDINQVNTSKEHF
jgi:hypothetical protein